MEQSSPTRGETSQLEISILNEGGKGDVRFVLQRLVVVTGTKKQTRACQYQLESLLLLRYQS